MITAHTATREDRLTADPSIITGSTNRHLLQPTKDNKKRRKSRIQNLKRSADKGSHGKSNESGPSTTKAKKQSVISTLFGQEESSSNASKTDRSQLVDLVVEDHEAEQVERVRAKKEGGPGWNEHQPKHFVYVSELKAACLSMTICSRLLMAFCFNKPPAPRRGRARGGQTGL